MKKYRLSDIETMEVSLVPKGANNKKFFLLKTASGDSVLKAQAFLTKLSEMKAEEAKKVCAGLQGEVKEVLISLCKSNQNNNQLLSELLAESVSKDGGPLMSEEKKETAPEVKEEVAQETTQETTEAKAEEQVEKLMKEASDLRKQNEELAKSLNEITEANLLKEYVEKAGEFKNLSISPEEFGPVLKTLATQTPEAFEKVMAVLKAADEALKQTELFKSAGSEATVSTGDSWARIEKLAEGLIEKSDKGFSKAKAIEQVLKTDEGKKLYNQYMIEMGGAA